MEDYFGYFATAAAEQAIDFVGRSAGQAFNAYKRNRSSWETSAPGDDFTPTAEPSFSKRPRANSSGVVAGMNGSGCYTKGKSTIGVPKYPRAQYNEKLVHVTKDHVTYRVQGLSPTPFGQGVTGYYRMCNTLCTSGLVQVAPLLLFELNCAPNVNKGNSTFQANPVSGYECYFSASIAGGDPTLVNFRPIAGFLGNWNRFAVENSSSTSGSPAQMGPRSLLDWVDIRMLWYSAGTVPTRIRIDIVSFNSDEMCPTGDADPSDSVVSVYQTPDKDVIALYQALTKRDMFNPLESANTALIKQNMTIHHSEQHVLDCKMSNMNELTKYKEIRIFDRLNRKCTWNWADDDLVKMKPDADYTVNTNKDWTHVEPKSRLYLMVRCISGFKDDGALTLGAPPDYTTNAPTLQTALNPSFDLVLRTRYTKMGAFQ